MINISITAEPVYHLGPLIITNSMLATWLTLGLILIFTLIARRGVGLIPRTKFANFVDLLIESFFNMTKSIVGSEKKSRQFFGLGTTLFIFVIVSNWIGIMPGFGTVTLSRFKTNLSTNTELSQSDNQPNAEHIEKVPLFRAPTADLNTTIALALISVVFIQYYSIKHLGLKSYLQKFFDFSAPIAFFVGLLEIVSELAKIISFGFRLFGNIFAGEVLLVVMASLLPFIGPIPFFAMEIFVGFIQAIVFSMLTIVFLSVATEKH